MELVKWASEQWSHKAPTFLADDLGGLHGALGALAAFTRRNISGEGQHVDVALVDSLIFQSNGYLTSGKMDIPLPKMGNQFSIAAPVNVYECLDGSIYGGVLLDNHWKALCVLLERPDLAELSGGERIEQRELVDKVVADWCLERTRDEVVTKLSDIGLAVTNVNTYGEAAEHPQVDSRDMLQQVTLSDGHSVPLTGPAAKFSRTPTRIHNAAPKLGENNAEIYGSLGLSEEQQEVLKKEGVL